MRKNLGFIISFVLIILLDVILNVSNIRYINDGENVRHTLVVMNKLDEVFSSIKDAETGERGYLLTSSLDYLEPYNKAITTLPMQIEELKKLTADNSEQTSNVISLQPLIINKLDQLKTIVDIQKQGKTELAITLTKTNEDKTLMDKITVLIQRMNDIEDSLLTSRSQKTQDNAVVLFAVLNTVMILVIVSAYFSVSKIRKFNTKQAELRSQVEKYNEMLIAKNKRLEDSEKELELRNKKIQKSIKDLDAVNNFMIGRELKMIDLKNEINKLNKK